MIRVQDKKLLTLLFIICDVGESSSNKYSAMVLNTCSSDGYTQRSNTSKRLNKPTRSEMQNNKTALLTFISEEKKVIHEIMKMSFTEATNDKCTSFPSAVVTFNQTDDYLYINTSNLFTKTQTAQIWLPAKSFSNLSQTQRKVGIVIYDSDDQFNVNLTNAIITSQVMRIEVPDCDIGNLTNPLLMHFHVNNKTTRNSTYSCQFFDEKENYTWKNDGCLTTQMSDDVVECSCNHMTAFAVLLVELKDLDEHHWRIMSYITYIGCSLSALFSACSILFYIIYRKARKVSNSIHVSLSGALFLLNITFILSEWVATLSINDACVFIAVMIHYSLLCSFTWMAIEALHLYILLIKVFNTYIKHYMFKLSLIGWGIPVVLIGVLLTVHNSHSLYGTKVITLSHETSETCWITDPVIVWTVNIVYFTLVFIFSSGVLIAVLLQIFKMRKVDHKHHKTAVCRDVGTTVGLMCLMGTTWSLAFFTSGYINYPILYLFCILNPMQGCFIFLWLCLTARLKKQREDHSSTSHR